MQLDELFKDKFFITDLLAEPEYEQNGETRILGRYAVWAPTISGERHSIVEVGTDIAYLMNKYNIGEDSICLLQQGRECYDH